MQERRKRILSEARRIIAAEGVDGLTTRKLASAAGVTQPTLYNLIGNKEAILEALLAELAGRFEPPEDWYPSNALEVLQAIVEGTALLYANDDSFKMMFHLYWRLEDRTWADRSDAAAMNIMRSACQVAADARLLRGRIPLEDLAEGLFSSYFVPLMQWAVGAHGPDEFRYHALKGMCISLCADAMPRFASQLCEQIEQCDRELTRLRRGAGRRRAARR